MKPISTSNIKSLHVGKIQFMVQAPPGAWGHKMEEVAGGAVLSVSADFQLRTDRHAFNNEILQILDKDVLDAAEKLAELVENHVAELLGSASPKPLTEIPEGIGNRGI
jgi:hypothetical protein